MKLHVVVIFIISVNFSVRKYLIHVFFVFFFTGGVFTQVEILGKYWISLSFVVSL